MKVLRSVFGPAVVFLLAFAAQGENALGDDFEPTGKWALIKHWGGRREMAIVEVTAASGSFGVRVLDAQRSWGATKVTSFDYRDGHVKLVLASERAKEIVFEGDTDTLPEGPHASDVVGTVQARFLDPARLRRTMRDQLAKWQPPPYQNDIKEAFKLDDVRGRSAALMQIVLENPGPETNFELRDVLIAAESAGLTENQVGNLIDKWFASVEPYGAAFYIESRLVVLRSLRGQKKFATLAFAVAQEARQKISGSTSATDQASLLRFLAEAAELTGHRDIARGALAEADAIDERLDAAYRAKVPPFKVDAAAGRVRAQGDRVVLLELFTGALCPPCVAADVACDALDSTFRPSELILLQYHLHLPGADPLANPSTIARDEYYGVRGVPTPFFNGEECPGGGGDLAAAEDKYNEYRQRIEALLVEKRLAEIDLSVSRSADLLTIEAAADASTILAERAAASGKNGKATTEPKLRLRLALTEQLVRYEGGNGVRFNRHVVRDFPGGVEGTQLDEGLAEATLAVDVVDVRKRLNDYSRSIASRLALACPRPLPKLRLEQLAIVAFIQDDATKRVLHAVQVAVPEQ